MGNKAYLLNLQVKNICPWGSLHYHSMEWGGLSPWQHSLTPSTPHIMQCSLFTCMHSQHSPHTPSYSPSTDSVTRILDNPLQLLEKKKSVRRLGCANNHFNLKSNMLNILFKCKYVVALYFWSEYFIKLVYHKSGLKDFSCRHLGFPPSFLL